MQSGIDLGTAISPSSKAASLSSAEGSYDPRSSPSQDRRGLVGRSPSVRPSPTLTAPSPPSSATWVPNWTDRRQIHAREISARILQKAKRAPGLGGPPKPSYGSCPLQRRAASGPGDAGQIAGLKVGDVQRSPPPQPWPRYGLEKEQEDKYHLVFDLGGGTFDVSLEVGKDDDGFSTIQVLPR